MLSVGSLYTAMLSLGHTRCLKTDFKPCWNLFNGLSVKSERLDVVKVQHEALSRSKILNESPGLQRTDTHVSFISPVSFSSPKDRLKNRDIPQRRYQRQAIHRFLQMLCECYRCIESTKQQGLSNLRHPFLATPEANNLLLAATSSYVHVWVEMR